MTPRVETHIRLGIHSVSPSDQSPRCPHEETLGPYLPIAKCWGVSPRTIAEILRGENPRWNKWFSFFRASGVPRRNAEKRAFSLGWSKHDSDWEKMWSLCTYQCLLGEGGWGDTWGLDSQNKPCPQELDERLWHGDGTLDVSARKSRRH